MFEDDFLLRAGGSRISGRAKDAALTHYIWHLKYPEFICLHHKFSRPSILFTMYTIKVLSRYLGGYTIRMNADKVMLVEKQVALDIFGQSPGVYAMRSRYYLAYAAYGLSCGIRDANELPDYGKRQLLCFVRNRIAPVESIMEAGESSTNRERASLNLQIEEITDQVHTEEPPPKRSRLSQQND